MRTNVDCESLFGGYNHYMRDLTKESNSCRLPLFYSDNDQCNNETEVRRTMLEHEADFKTQVLELHRVYRTQKDMMDEAKSKQFNKEWVQIGHSASFPLANSVYDRPSMPVVEDNGHSAMTGNNFEGVVGSGPWQNGASSNNAEMSEIRPTKMRRKMIDLCLPAEEYIDDNDEVVELKDQTVCSSLSQLPNGDVNTNFLRDGMRIGYGSSRSNALADLNEPVVAQEANEFAHCHSHDLRNGEVQGHICDYRQSINSGSTKERTPAISPQPDLSSKQKGWLHQPSRIDHYTGTHKSAAPFFQPLKQQNSSSQPMQALMNSSQRVMSLSNSGPPSNKAVFWRERTFIDLEADTDTNTTHEAVFHKNHLKSSLASHQDRNLYPYNRPDSAASWNHFHSSWQNPSFRSPQKVASDTLIGNAQKQGYIGDRLQFESNSRFDSGCGISSWSSHNIVNNECSSSSKSKLVGTGFNYTDRRRSDYSSEMKYERDFNLNVTLSDTSVVEVRMDEEEHLATLPWLKKPKSVCNSEMANGKSNLKSNDEAREKVLKLKSASCSNNLETEKLTANVEIPGSAYKDQSNAQKCKAHNVRVLDMNELCDPLWDEDQQREELIETKVSGSNRCQIDLNMAVSDEEDNKCSVPESLRLDSKVLMIDLEVVPESDDEEANENISGEKPTEGTLEFEKLAAEAIVAISSACLDRELEVVASLEASDTTVLHWFAETVNTHKENLDKKLDTFSRKQGRSIEEIDYFESMTLQLPEITEEEYMPKPLFPSDLKWDETSGPSQRPRRGNARKGKQKRDFQRDILPGLLSLTKHEVTEDFQMFDGFMRATGSSWSPNGLARKKTRSRGRPRRVITIPEPECEQLVANQSNNGESKMELEDRSFTGWSKMTRRPRRQRCPSTTTTATAVKE